MMRNIKKWVEFNESKLYYSQYLYNVVLSAPREFDEIAKDFLDFWDKETGVDLSFIDLEGDGFSYSTDKNIEKTGLGFIKPFEKPYFIVNGRLTDLDRILTRNSNIYGDFVRGNVKIGRFLKKLFGDKYSDSEIESFVNYLKSHSKNINNYRFEIVKGNDIARWYKESGIKAGSVLSNSCMRGKPSEYFDIYTKNTEVCSLLLMFDSDNHLVARALLWDVKINYRKDHEYKDIDGVWIDGTLKAQQGPSGSKKYLDRIYYENDWMVSKIKSWAKENIDKNIITEDIFPMSVKIKRMNYSKFPYVDTFRYYDVANCTLYNQKPKDFKGFTLQSTQGMFDSTDKISNFRNYIRKYI